MHEDHHWAFTVGAVREIRIEPQRLSVHDTPDNVTLDVIRDGGRRFDVATLGKDARGVSDGNYEGRGTEHDGDACSELAARVRHVSTIAEILEFSIRR
jgi:hypothetical protein